MFDDGDGVEDMKIIDTDDDGDGVEDTMMMEFNLELNCHLTLIKQIGIITV